MPWNRVLAGGGVAGLAALAGRYAAGLARLSDLGEVDEVSILPLVERLTPDGSGLTGEPGVSYLIRAGGMRVLFDSGLAGARRNRRQHTTRRCWARPWVTWTPW